MHYTLIWCSQKEIDYLIPSTLQKSSTKIHKFTQGKGVFTTSEVSLTVGSLLFIINTHTHSVFLLQRAR